MILMLRFVMNGHVRKPLNLGRKLDKVGLEMAEAMAALVQSSQQEILENHPLSAAALNREFRELFAEEDANIELELQSAPADKKADWKPTDLTVVASLLKNQEDASNARMSEEVELVRVQVTQLEREEFPLVKKKFSTMLVCGVCGLRNCRTGARSSTSKSSNTSCTAAGWRNNWRRPSSTARIVISACT